MVIFTVTPWMGNKPKFWICGRRGEVSVHPAAVGGVEDKVQRDNPPARPGNFRAPGMFLVGALRLCRIMAGVLRSDIL